MVVLLPARMSRREEDHWVATMLERLERRARRVAPGDDELERRARLLARRYLEGMVEPRSVAGWATCGPATAPAPLTTAPSASRTVAPWPPWVRDYVLVHELAHLAVPDPLARLLAPGRPLPAVGAGPRLLIAKGMEEDDD